MDWDTVDPSQLFATIREQTTAPDAERTVWAFEHLLAAVRIDPESLDHLAVAGICALAFRDGETPRFVLEQLFRRAIPDERWRQEFAGLLDAQQ